MRILALFVLLGMAAAQQLPVVTSVEQQPLAAQVSRLLEALQFLGEPLPAEETAQLKQPGTTPAEIQKILDRHCLVGVEINPESRVKVQEGPAKAELVEQGWRTFLVKVINQAGITPVLAAESPNAGMREARLEFNVGQGTQDLGFRSQVDLLFNTRPAAKVTLRVLDTDDRPTTASFLVHDAENRVYPSQAKRLAPD